MQQSLLGFLVVGLNHRSAPLEVRERLSLNPGQIPGALAAMDQFGVPGAIISTCNRSEFYTLEPSGPAGAGHSQGRVLNSRGVPAPGTELHSQWGIGDRRCREFLVDYFDIPLVEVERYLYCHRDENCIRHLFRVASSLDSMIQGEDQIIGQVRESLEIALHAGTIKGPLLQLFQQALHVGRKVRRETGIGKNALSVSRACVEMARGTLGDLSQLQAMVVGAGDAAGLAAKVLNLSGVREITVTNRTHERAQELARNLSGRAVPFNRMQGALTQADLVISCTGSPGYVLTSGAVKSAMESRPDRPLFLLDIAVPRDIDPASANIGNVTLHDVDDLDAISDTYRLERTAEAGEAEQVVEEETGKFVDWCAAQRSLSTVVALREQAEQMRLHEIQKTVRRADLEFNPEQRAALDAMTKALVKKLLHGPTVYLKDHGDSVDLGLTREMFQLPHEDP